MPVYRATVSTLKPANATRPGTVVRDPRGAGVGEGSCDGSGTIVGSGVGLCGDGGSGVAVARLWLISGKRSGGMVGITTGVGTGVGMGVIRDVSTPA